MTFRTVKGLTGGADTGWLGCTVNLLLFILLLEMSLRTVLREESFLKGEVKEGKL